MRIEHIEVRNYRAFRHATFSDLPRMAVIIGANGSGKSTLFDALRFLQDALARNAESAVNERGGFRELVSRGERGPIGITIKFREDAGPLVTYLLEVAEREGRVVVQREVLRHRRGTDSGRPWNFVDFSCGKGQVIVNESVDGALQGRYERDDYSHPDPSALAIAGLGQFLDFPVACKVRRTIENWHVSGIQIAAARTGSQPGCSQHLSSSGDNLAQAAHYLYRNHRKRFDEALAAMRRSVPGVSGIEARPTEDGRLALRFQDGSFRDPFIARYASDGTIRMFAYLVLLLDPSPHPLLAIQEPENQVYPHLLEVLAEEFRDYARRGGQAFVATHSPDFLNGARIEEIFHLFKRNGFATVRRASQSEILRRFFEEGDPPGLLWRQGLLDNVDLP